MSIFVFYKPKLAKALKSSSIYEFRGLAQALKSSSIYEFSRVLYA